jgi:sigma-B regulation protein RsbU (phosphoserine phosphatase)
MAHDNGSVEQLTTLNHISETLNRAVDVRSVLNDALAHLVKLMGLETGWIFLREPAPRDLQGGSAFVLAAHHNLPQALDTTNAEVWEAGCDCQTLCNEHGLTSADNILQCRRLARASDDRLGLGLHASAPLRSRDTILGILNVAGADWSSFSAEALTLLTNVSNQIGVALERARLFDLLQDQRLQEQMVMVEFTNQLLGRQNLDDILGYLVEEARTMLQADACALLLPGDSPNALRFRAASGWRNDPVASSHRAPAGDGSGPGLVMRTRTPLLAEDIVLDDPTPWLPEWIVAEGFRGHAVMPLVAERKAVGALVVDMRQPRLLDEHQVRLLRLMANQAALAIEKARLHQQEVERQILDKEFEVAQQVQVSLLPKTLPQVPGWEFEAYYHAAKHVGGDFYDIFALPDEPERLGLVIADVSGKGVPAAIFMALSHTLIRTTTVYGRQPSVALLRANQQILEENRTGQFVSVCHAVLDTRSGRLVFANAGHNPPLWVQAATGQVRELEAPGIVLGVLDEIELAEGAIDVAAGDLLIFFTDGVTEAMDSRQRVLGAELLQEIARDQAQASARQVLESVIRAVKLHTGDAPPSDDLALLVVKRCPPGLTSEVADQR